MQQVAEYGQVFAGTHGSCHVVPIGAVLVKAGGGPERLREHGALERGLWSTTVVECVCGRRRIRITSSLDQPLDETLVVWAVEAEVCHVAVVRTAMYGLGAQREEVKR
jgi:hypothetical protein